MVKVSACFWNCQQVMHSYDTPWVTQKYNVVCKMLAVEIVHSGNPFQYFFSRNFDNLVIPVIVRLYFVVLSLTCVALCGLKFEEICATVQDRL